MEVLMTNLKVTDNEDESNHDQLLSSLNQDDYEESTMSNPKVTEDQDEKQPTASSTSSVTNFGEISQKNSQNYGENSGGFDIRQFTSALEESHKPGKYICPACQGANLSIDENSGAYNCWNDDSAEHRKEIRNKLSPPKKPSSSQSQPKLSSVEQIATIDEPAPVETHTNKNDESSETLYPYTADESLHVIRKDYYKYEHDKDTGEVVDRKKEKAVRPYYTDSEGNVKCGSKGIDFPPYRIDEALTYGADKYVVFVEGEKTVESLRMKGIIAITLQGSKWDAEDMTRRLTRLKHEGQVKGVIVFPDHDEAGDKKARKVIKAANQSGMHSLLVSPEKVWADMPEKGDASDWLDTVQPDRRAALEALLNASYEASENGNTKTKEQLELDEYVGIVDTKNTYGFYWNKSEALKDLPDDGRLVAYPGRSIERCMAEYLKEDWLTETEEFYRYTGKGYYEKLTESRVKQEISKFLEEVWELKEIKSGNHKYYQWEISEAYANAKNQKNCFNYSQPVLTNIRDFDNSKLICFRNTTINVETKEDVGHSKQNKILTPPLAGDYTPDAECPPVFDAFLRQSFGEKMIPLIRAFTSLLLDPTAPFGNHTVPHILGQSGSGKGTLLRVWSEMMGESSGQIPDFGILNDPDKIKQYVDGKRLLINPDTSGMQLNMQAFYELVDNGRMSVRKLHSSETESKKLYCRFALASVNPLQFENAGEGAARRITTIPTKTPDEDRIKDPYLDEKLIKELSQIVSWAISMNRYERDRWIMTAGDVPEVAKAKEAARISGDSVRSFIDESIRHDSKEDSYLAKELLYSSYKTYCDWSGVKPLGKTKFWNHLNSFASNRLYGRTSTSTNGAIDHIPPRFVNAKFTHPSLYTYDEHSKTQTWINPQHFLPGGLEHLGLQ
jgi:phage/plasmid-associated DNA primase/5S rRNA maturation endonuclease (ribonuclease M5)